MCCLIQGLHQPPTEALDETETIVLATQWHRRFHRERHLQAVVAERDELGLRKMTHSPKSASLPHIMVDKSAWSCERDEMRLSKVTHSPKSASLPHIMVDKSAWSCERDEMRLSKVTHSPKSASLPHIMVDKSAWSCERDEIRLSKMTHSPSQPPCLISWWTSQPEAVNEMRLGWVKWLIHQVSLPASYHGGQVSLKLWTRRDEAE